MLIINSVLDAERKQWVKQDNRGWNELQNKANMLREVVAVDNALQEQNKALSDTLRAELRDAWNTDMITKGESKGESQRSSFPSKEYKPSLIYSNAKKERAVNELHPALSMPQRKDKKNSFPITGDEVIPQHSVNKDYKSSVDVNPDANMSFSTAKTTLNASTEMHLNLLPKLNAVEDTEKPSTLADDKKNAILSRAFFNPEVKAKTLTPQIASSLMMPNAMFAVGFADMNNQNALLDNMRITMFEPKDNKERGIFFSTYGNRITLSSTPNPPQDGARADIRYAALQAGLTLITLEDQNTNTDFGLLGTYGKLAFTPKNRGGSQKSLLDKWLLTAYGNIQHDNGMYASAFLSCGIFKGKITNALTRNTKKANDPRTLEASATVGQKLPTSVDGITLEPQAQLVYRRLILSTLSDDGNFKVNMGNPYQWLLHIGGRLTQNKGHAISFYGKLNIIKAFDRKEETIQIDESFQLASMGTSIEGGFGINVHLSQNIALHGDISYQHKLKKAGISGVHVSSGMRYRF
ncbi:autotransporter outer membrane beta-barrel domain-containing protein [Bartonella heixiaziensis]|uniref:autotransporter outer membrane beta-barrel domain-containing protein n=1 Tax=Bartonella heixiaziensis TaxID=1461000 RepID=UPI003908B0C7